MSTRRPRGRARRLILPFVGVVALLAANGPPVWEFVSNYAHQRLINSPEYKAKYGYWATIDLPKNMRVNAIHAALLDTGKILIVAGSGNDAKQFEAGTFKTLIYDPVSGATKLVPTPTDIFCAGHAFLPSGNLLVAGGTLRYEVLAADVTKAAGTMVVKNESPDGVPRTFPKGTQFVSPTGIAYVATAEFTVKPAVKIHNPGTPVKITPSETSVWVEAAEDGATGLSQGQTHYTITGLSGEDSHNIYGLSDKMTLDKQDYQGRKETYEFNPQTEQYERVGDMAEQRWYPTLTGLPDGQVLAVSGLDGSGQVVNGHNEIYDPTTKTWTVRDDLERYFPTYPALFQTSVAGRIFFSGSNSGYGPAEKGRDPGFWDLTTNTFTTVPGLRDADQLETSGSVWAGPIQDQKIMVVGGGGVGESPKSSARIDIIDLDSSPSPTFQPGPELPEPTRYPILVTLPDDTTLITGGSSDYRGRGSSDLLQAALYHPDTNSLSFAAAPSVGRDYHSEGLLLPDGRVITLGSNPLFTDEKNTITAPFEQRIEIYSPAYLYQGTRPVLSSASSTVSLGGTIQVTTPDAARIATARLIRPSAATHVTNVEQRAIALGITASATGLNFSVPDSAALVPPGYYMLFVTDTKGVPSVARWVLVS